MKKRAGAPETGVVAAEGTSADGTDPRIVLFEKPVSPCIVTSHTAAFKAREVSIKVNTELNGVCSDPFTQASGLGHFVLSIKRTELNLWKDGKEGGECHVDVSCGGQIAVHSVSFAMMGDMDDISVVGWRG